MMYQPTYKPLIEEYPELAEYPEFKIKGYDREAKYVMYLLDPESPFYKITDFDLRKKSSAEKAGFENLLDIRTVAMLEGRDRSVNAMVTRMLMLVNNYDFENWFTVKCSYHSLSDFLRTSPDTEDSKRISEEMKNRSAAQKELVKMAKDIILLENKIFPNDAIRRQANTIVGQRIGNFAEKYAITDDV